MQAVRFSMIALALVPAVAFSQVECTDRPECWPEGSAMHTGLVLAQQREAVEARLADRHAALVELVAASSTADLPVDRRLLDALQSQQAAWLRYRNEECELIGTLTGSGGRWPSTYATRCELNHADQRLRRVRSAIRCIGSIPVADRIVDQYACLQQLAPLTNR